jgi:RHS repeat-associated protein
VPETPFEASYDAANRMTQITLEPGTPQAKTYDLGYNASGQLITKQNRATPTDTTTYGWDTRGRLTSLSAPGVEASFSYDPLGRRSERRVNGQSTRYVYDGVQALGELREDANGNATLLTGVGIDEMIARYTQAGERSFLTDALGSVIALAKEDQSVVTRYAYSPYGQSQASGAQEGNASQYTARENDATGLYYYRARYYDAVLKRFVSEDPIGLEGGVNTYGFVGGNPISYLDPLGEAKNDKYKTPPNPNKREPPEHRKPSGDRERNVKHPEGEEHSRVPKRPIRTPGGPRAFCEPLVIWDIVNEYCLAYPDDLACWTLNPPREFD